MEDVSIYEKSLKEMNIVRGKLVSENDVLDINLKDLDCKSKGEILSAIRSVLAVRIREVQSIVFKSE